MAELIGLKERQAALADINIKLKELEKVKAFLTEENPSGFYKISFDKHRVTIHCPDGEAIRSLVSARKAEMVKELRELAAKHQIEFSEEDEAILS